MSPRTRRHNSLRSRTNLNVSKSQGASYSATRSLGQCRSLFGRRMKKQIATKRRNWTATRTLTHEKMANSNRVDGKVQTAPSSQRVRPSNINNTLSPSNIGRLFSSDGSEGADSVVDSSMTKSMDNEQSGQFDTVTMPSEQILDRTVQSIIACYEEERCPESWEGVTKLVYVRFAPCQYCDLCGSSFVLRATEVEKHIKKLHPQLVETIDLPRKALLPRGIMYPVGTFEMPGNTFSIGPYAALTFMCLQEPRQLFSQCLRELVLLNRFNGRRYRVFPKVAPLPSFEVPAGGFRKHLSRNRHSTGYWPRGKDSDLETLLDVFHQVGYKDAFMSGAMSVLTEYKAQRVEAFPSEVVDCRVCGETVLLHPLEVIFHLSVHGLPLETLFGPGANVDWRNLECVACFDSKRLKKLSNLDMVGLLRHLKQCPMRNKLFSRGAYPLCLFEHAIASASRLNQSNGDSLRVAGKDELANILHSIPHVPGWCIGRNDTEGASQNQDVWSEHSYARCECAAELKLSLCEFPRVVLDEDASLDSRSVENSRTQCEEAFVKVERVYDEYEPNDGEMCNKEMDFVQLQAYSVKSQGSVYDDVNSEDSSPERAAKWFIPFRFIAEALRSPKGYLEAIV